MAFTPLPNGLVQMDTAAGPIPVTPDVARQAGWDMAAPTPLAQMPGATAGLVMPEGIGGGDTGPVDVSDGVSVGAPIGVSLGNEPPRNNPATVPTPGPVEQPVAGPEPVAAEEPVDNRSLTQRYVQSQMEAGPRRSYHAERAAGFTPGARQVRGVTPLSPTTRAAVEGAQVKAGESDIAEGKAGAEAADVRAELAKTEADAAANAVDREAKIRERQNAQLQALKAARDKKRAEVSAQEIDPDRWDRTGGVGRVLATIAVGLSQASRAFGGGDNGVQQMFDKLKDDDINAQKYEFQRAQEAGEKAENDYADAFARYGDPVLAEREAAILHNDAVTKQLEARLAKAQSPADKAAIEALMAQREADRKRELDQFDGRGVEFTEAQQWDPGQKAGWSVESPEAMAKRIATGGKSVQELEALSGSGADPYAGMSEKDKSDWTARQVTLPNGDITWARTPQAADAAVDRVRSADVYLRNVAEMRALAERGLAGQLDAKDRGKMRALVTQNIMAQKALENLGALAGADLQLVEPIVGGDLNGPLTINSGVLAALDANARYVQNIKDTVESNLIRDVKGTPYRSGTSTGRESALGGKRQ